MNAFSRLLAYANKNKDVLTNVGIGSAINAVLGGLAEGPAGAVKYGLGDLLVSYPATLGARKLAGGPKVETIIDAAGKQVTRNTPTGIENAVNFGASLMAPVATDLVLGSGQKPVVPSDVSADNSLISGTTAQTYWVTYMFANVTGGTSPLNYLPCNYFTKVEVNTNTDSCSVSYPSNISLKFGNEFGYMKTSLSSVNLGYTAKQMFVLLQSTGTNQLPNPDSWKIIPITGLTTNGSGYLEPSGLTGNTITINKTMFTGASYFDLETYMGTDYLGYSGSTTEPQFGDEQPFPGSVKLVRATDVEQMNFLINLPSGKFTKSQNPTYSTGDSMITEVTLLDSGKNPLVIAKTPTPIRRTGTQVFSIKLDF